MRARAFSMSASVIIGALYTRRPDYFHREIRSSGVRNSFYSWRFERVFNKRSDDAEPENRRRQMKFWELTSYLRSQHEAVARTLNDPRWAKFATWFAELERHVRDQNRSILDADVDPELVRLLLALSVTRYRVEAGWLRKADPASSDDRSLSAVEIFD